MEIKIMSDLTLTEKAALFDKVVDIAKWEQAGITAGCWRIEVWTNRKELGLSAALGQLNLLPSKKG